MHIKALITIHAEQGIFAPGQVFSVPDEEAEVLISRGFAEASAEVIEDDKGSDSVPLEEMTVKQLKEVAKTLKIDLGEAKSKDEIFAIVSAYVQEHGSVN